jgi:hypothetical protein
MMHIPNDQLCQAFDPILTMPEKIKNLPAQSQNNPNTSCIAPAFVYMEGSHGKRFLCDYHYALEKVVNKAFTPHLWETICSVLINNLEKVKETFNKDANNTSVLQNKKCWCTKEAFISIEHKVLNEAEIPPYGEVVDGKVIQYYCNFHFRKSYYRILNHGVDILLGGKFTDERWRMTQTINEEIDTLKWI